VALADRQGAASAAVGVLVVGQLLCDEAHAAVWRECRECKSSMKHSCC
jgi:hypothetical protein